MRLINLFLFCCLLIFFPSYGQDAQNDRFCKRYIEEVFSLKTINNKDAHHLVDSLSHVAHTDEQKLQVHLLSAQLFEKEGNMYFSIRHAMLADTIANTSMNFSCQTLTSIYLAASFRKMGLFKVSSLFLAKAEAANHKQKNELLKAITRVNILHEKALNSIEEEVYEDAMYYVTKAQSLIEKGSKANNQLKIQQAMNYSLLGTYNFHLGKLDRANIFLLKSLEMLEGLDNNLTPYIYHTMTELNIKKEDIEKAMEYLSLLEPYLQLDNSIDLKIKVCDSWSKIYKQTGDILKYQEYIKKSRDIRDANSKISKKLMDEYIVHLKNAKQDYRIKYFIVVGGFIIVLLTACFIVLYFHKKEINIKRKYEIVKDNTKERTPFLDNIPEVNIKIPLEKPDNASPVKVKEINISKHTERRLYKEFVKQEAKMFYLEKSITLNQLATSIGTNPRYVTYIIQKFREKDFYDYVQTKRIEYIIEQIQKSPELLSFKLSYLADMCGFTTLSKFSTAFKMVTGMPPSAYVHLIKKDLNGKL